MKYPMLAKTIPADDTAELQRWLFSFLRAEGEKYRLIQYRRTTVKLFFTGRGRDMIDTGTRANNRRQRVTVRQRIVPFPRGGIRFPHPSRSREPGIPETNINKTILLSASKSVNLSVLFLSVIRKDHF